MNLRKESWEKVLLRNVCDIDPSKKEISELPNDTLVSFAEMADLNEHKPYFNYSQEKTLKEVRMTGFSYFRENDVLLAKMTPCYENGKSGLAKDLLNGIGFGSTEFFVLRGKSLLPELIYHLVESDQFIQKGKLMMIGTTGRKRLMKDFVLNYEIPLPPDKEQKQIAKIFQSIETIIEQSEIQEKNLKALWKKLINDLVSNKPSFGNLLKDKKLKMVNYCDVTEKLMRKIDPLTYAIERIVAGENLESEDFQIRTWQKIGEGYLGPAFHVLFKKGDILYGSRRTYLRKVSLADFDGVCSNTTYVIKANEKLLLQDLLKHIMLSERFTQYSIGVSKGSTNPYINWKDLDNFSFQIPEIEIQKKIVSTLDGIIEIIEQLKKQKATLKNIKQKLLSEILG
jgi:restriction endonuclease S subunit